MKRPKETFINIPKDKRPLYYNNNYFPLILTSWHIQNIKKLSNKNRTDKEGVGGLTSSSEQIFDHV